MFRFVLDRASLKATTDCELLFFSSPNIKHPSTNPPPAPPIAGAKNSFLHPGLHFRINHKFHQHILCFFTISRAFLVVTRKSSQCLRETNDAESHSRRNAAWNLYTTFNEFRSPRNSGGKPKTKLFNFLVHTQKALTRTPHRAQRQKRGRKQNFSFLFYWEFI